MNNKHSLRRAAAGGLGAIALLLVSGCVREETGSVLGDFLKDTVLAAIAALLL